ncbi:MAG TPA: CpsD/CapB family tyrosine-protein kinase [Blastocatellia bacterium]|nr:CpsD/CapB family tyrosine-protein kinase [Blastocatellia bacterium]
MGRVYNALVRAGNWTDQPDPRRVRRGPGSAARPVESPLQEAGQPGSDETSQPAVGYPIAVEMPKADQTQPGQELRDPEAPPRPGPHASGAKTAKGPDKRDVVVRQENPAGRHSGTMEPGQASSKQPLIFPTFLDQCASLQTPVSIFEQQLTALSRDDRLARERYQTLSVRIYNLARKRGMKTIAVTSACAVEGKTTVSANLSLVLARNSEGRVLLIDGDVRRPSAAIALGVSPEHGWTDLLEGRSDFAKSVVRLQPSGLYLLADRAGVGMAPNVNQSPGAMSSSFKPGADLLTSSRPERLIKELEPHFSLILIDTPPISDFAEAQQLASITDGTVIVVRAGETHHRAVADALKLVPKERRLGVVLNQTARSSL